MVPKSAIAERVSAERPGLRSGTWGAQRAGAGLARSSPLGVGGGRRTSGAHSPPCTGGRLGTGGSPVGLESGGAFSTKKNRAQAETGTAGLRHFAPRAAALTGGELARPPAEGLQGPTELYKPPRLAFLLPPQYAEGSLGCPGSEPPPSLGRLRGGGGRAASPRGAYRNWWPSGRSRRPGRAVRKQKGWGTPI